jgi:hypothetical protein
MPSRRFAPCTGALAQRAGAGVTTLDRGEFTEVEEEDLGAYLDDLAFPARR